MTRPNYRVRERLVLRRSSIHGNGVYAREFIRAGTRIVEYRGEMITDAEGDQRYPYQPGVPYHTFLFRLDDNLLLDAGSGGNIARWINHSCDPNCETLIDGMRIYVEAIRDISPGEELTYEYHLIVPERHTPAVKKRYPCRCGTEKCRGTMLGRKR
jgi:uncharacterized protein